MFFKRNLFLNFSFRAGLRITEILKKFTLHDFGVTMKKYTVFAALILFTAALPLSSQTNTTINLSDEIYRILENAQLRGLCNIMPGTKPYTETRILKAVDEILLNSEKLNGQEIIFLTQFKEKHKREMTNSRKFAELRFASPNLKIPASIQLNFGQEVIASGGLYTQNRFDQWGFDWITTLDFAGDLGNSLSYKMTVLFDITRMPLYELKDDYFIGYNWYAAGVGEYLDAETSVEPERRTVKKMLNTSYLPYSYKKYWGGQIYLFNNLTASGLEGWAMTPGMSGNIFAEVGLSFFDDKFNILLGRTEHEWGAMDNGASLVFNSSALPFAAFDIRAEIFPFVRFSSLSGILEYPNQDYINIDGLPKSEGKRDDAFFYQNGFSINMVELDLKYLHFDFGTSVVWPKRFELGYVLPLMNFVEYQNHIGDYDNLALFSNIKGRISGLGSVWASIYLDEINGLNNDPVTSTRAMYAGQLGTKWAIPGLPFASISLRYTKVEPYCYTHHSINYTPWYNHYINTGYTNNGYSLGYYLDPNSDETALIFEMRPRSNINSIFKYQFIRHGADYGSQQVPGSSLYSELSPKNRNKLKKYFLHDGAYNWMHIISAEVGIDLKYKDTPVKLFTSAGLMYSYYTMIDSTVYEKRKALGNNGNSGADKYTKFYIADTYEYPAIFGAVLTVGIKVWKK